MKTLALIAILVGMSGLAQAGAIDITLHSTGDPFVDLSTILGQWGTPGATGTAFAVPGGGSNEFGALDLFNDTGVTISSIEIYAYGTVGSGSLNPSCADGSGYSAWTCSAPTDPGTNVTISQSHPLEWIYTSGGTSSNIGLNTEFKLVDTSGAATGADLFWEVEINGAGPTAATPEPSTFVPVLAAGIAIAFLATRRRKAVSNY